MNKNRRTRRLLPSQIWLQAGLRARTSKLGLQCAEAREANGWARGAGPARAEAGGTSVANAFFAVVGGVMSRCAPFQAGASRYLPRCASGFKVGPACAPERAIAIPGNPPPAMPSPGSSPVPVRRPPPGTRRSPSRRRVGEDGRVVGVGHRQNILQRFQRVQGQKQHFGQIVQRNHGRFSEGSGDLVFK